MEKHQFLEIPIPKNELDLHLSIFYMLFTHFFVTNFDFWTKNHITYFLTWYPPAVNPRSNNTHTFMCCDLRLEGPENNNNNTMQILYEEICYLIFKRVSFEKFVKSMMPCFLEFKVKSTFSWPKKNLCRRDRN